MGLLVGLPRDGARREGGLALELQEGDRETGRTGGAGDTGLRVGVRLGIGDEDLAPKGPPRGLATRDSDIALSSTTMLGVMSVRDKDLQEGSQRSNSGRSHTNGLGSGAAHGSSTPRALAGPFVTEEEQEPFRTPPRKNVARCNRQ